MTASQRPHPTRALRVRPDLEQLKRQAKELLDAFRAGEPAATAEVGAHYRDADPTTFALHDAHLVLARAYGFDSWRKLKAYVEGATVRRLTEAVSAGDIDTVRTMIEARPELVRMELAENDERTALHFAVLARSSPIVELLMQHGAEPWKGVYPHRTATSPFAIARDRGFSELITIMDEWSRRRHAANPDPHEDTHGGGPLARAAKHGNLEEARRLLETAVDPDEKVRLENLEEVVYSGGFPLRYAVQTSNLPMAALLLEHGADPNIHVYASGSALYVAYTRRDQPMIQLLRDHGGFLDARTVGILGETELARELLDDEAAGRLRPGSIVDTPGNSAAEELLGGAAGSGKVAIVRMALARLDWTPEDPTWHWILHESLYIGEREPAEREPFHDVFRIVLERADPNVRSGRGSTVLHEIAASRGGLLPEEQVKFAAMLLDRGARLDVRDDLLRSTPLGWACRWGRVELAKLLVARGADVREMDAEPWARPSAWAHRYGNTEALAVLEGGTS